MYPPKTSKITGKRKSAIKVDLRKSRLKTLINENLKITDVAKDYGLKVRGFKAVCPFHNDTDPSLSLNDELNVFNCFGCSAKGDIIEFIRRLDITPSVTRLKSTRDNSNLETENLEGNDE